MSNHARCPDCNHVRGPRSTAPLTKDGTNRPKKASCSCACHRKDGEQ